VPSAAQQLSAEAASAGLLPPLVHLLHALHQLLHWWTVSLPYVPTAATAVLHMVLPLSQQLQHCSSQVLGFAAGPVADTGMCAFFNAEYALGVVVYRLYEVADVLVAADLRGLQHEAALAELQLQVLAALTAEMHKDHVAHQQQQLLLQQQQELPAAAGKSSSNRHSSSHAQQQLQLQASRPAKQQWHADLLSIPAFHQDMLPLLPGGQVYLDAAGAAMSGWRLTSEDRAIQIRELAHACCCILLIYVQQNLASVSGQQQLGGS
jgi:hypothetical protein